MSRAVGLGSNPAIFAMTNADNWQDSVCETVNICLGLDQNNNNITLWSFVL